MFFLRMQEQTLTVAQEQQREDVVEKVENKQYKVTKILYT
jgi:hypothetical protein